MFMKSFNRLANDPFPILILMAVFSVAIHLLVMNNLEYNRDELLYFSLGQHPAAGYATVPPMIGWIAWLMKSTFGYSMFSVRIIPALMSGVMVMVVSGIARELGGGSYSRFLAALGFLISGFGLRTFSMFMPVFIDMFFWTIIIYVIIRFINTSSGKYLILLGLVAGLSLLNKYLIGILFLSLFIAVSFSENRKVLVSRYFWYGIAGGILIFLPNLIWQVVNGFPVLRHMAELERTQLVHVDRLAFLFDQFMMPSFASFLTIAGIIYLLIDKEAIKFRFLAVSCLLVIIILMLLRGKGYYTIGIFPFLIAAGSVSYEKSKRLWVRIALPVLLTLLTIPVIPMGLPVYKEKGLISYFKAVETRYGIVFGRRFEDGSIHSLPQDYADMLGWEELTAAAAKAYNMVENKKAAFIYGENYGEAGAITVIGKKYGLPEAISFNESFQYWAPKKFDPDITAVVYINYREPGPDVKSLFRKITPIGGITNPNSREYGTTVYLCEDPVSSFNGFWKVRLTKK
jgi:hypothetical protein